MRIPFLHSRLCRSAAALLGLSALAAGPAFADGHLFSRRHKQDCCPTPYPVVETRPVTPAKPEAKPVQPEVAPTPTPAPVLTDERFGALASETVAVAWPPNMIGDFIGANGISCNSCTVSSSRTQSSFSREFLPSQTRVFKIADNESPIPHDRVYLDYKYFTTVNRDLNHRLDALAAQGGFLSTFTVPDVHRYTLGAEKTLLGGDASIGVRLPVTTINTLEFDLGFQGLATPTLSHNEASEVGDLAIIFKSVLARDNPSGSLLTAGLLFTIPTGPDTIDPNANPNNPFAPGELYHSTTFQPFLGWVIGMGDWFIHGFTSVDIPTDDRDATLWFNDIGLGWYAYRGSGLVSGIVPTVEAHLTTPLSHKDPLASADETVATGNLFLLDPSSVPQTLVMTYGVTAILDNQVTVGVAFAHPLTGPKPYDYEIQFQLNVYFGGPASQVPSGPRTGRY